MCEQIIHLNKKNSKILIEKIHTQPKNIKEIAITINAANNKGFFNIFSSHLNTLQISMPLLMPYPAYSSALNHWEI